MGYRPYYNKHHILYPAHVWRDLTSDHTLRDCFVIKGIDRIDHDGLHRALDRKIDMNPASARLPEVSTLERITKEYLINRDSVDQLNNLQRIDWLLARFLKDEKSNRWIRKSLILQRDYLSKRHIL